MNIITTFKEFNNQNIVIIEFLNDYDINYLDLITEDFHEFKLYKKDDRVFLPLSKFQTEKLKIINDELNSYINNLNPVEYDLVIENGMKKYRFNIKLTEHYVSKFIRKEMEDPLGIRGIKNPDKYDGINLIVNNMDIICNRLHKYPLPIGQQIAIIGTSGDYEVLFVLDRSHKRLYELKLITQIKGDIKLSRNTDRTTNKSPLNWKLTKNPPKI